MMPGGGNPTIGLWSLATTAPVVVSSRKIWGLISFQNSTKSQRMMLPGKLALLWSPDTSLICPSRSQLIQRSFIHHQQQLIPLILHKQEPQRLRLVVHDPYLCLLNPIPPTPPSWLPTPQPLQMSPTTRTALMTKTRNDGNTEKNIPHPANLVVQTEYWVITPLVKPWVQAVWGRLN